MPSPVEDPSEDLAALTERFCTLGSLVTPAMFDALLDRLATDDADSEDLISALTALRLAPIHRASLSDATRSRIATLARHVAPSSVRAAAVALLAEAIYPEQGPVLKALGDGAPAVRQAAALALFDRAHCQMAGPVRKAYRCEADPDVKATLLKLITQWGDRQDLDRLCHALDVPYLRLTALEAFHHDISLGDLIARNDHERVADGSSRWDLLKRLPEIYRRIRAEHTAKDAIEKITRILLSDPDAQCRTEAALALRFVPDVTPALARALADENDDVLQSVLTALCHRDEEEGAGRAECVPALIALHERKPHLCHEIAELVCRTPHPDSTPFLLTAYTAEPSAVLRLALIESLHLSRSPAIPMLRQALEDTDQAVRLAAAAALGAVAYWNDPAPDATQAAMCEALLEAIHHSPDPAVRLAAAEALDENAPQDSMPDLLALAASATDPDLTAALLTTCAAADADQSRDALLAALASPAPLVRHAAADALAFKGEAAVWPSFHERIENSSLPKRQRAALMEQLAFVPNPAVPRYLLEALRRGAPWQARSAALALGGHGTPQAIDALCERLAAPLGKAARAGDEEEDEVRIAAMNALAHIGDSASARSIAPYLQDADASIRRRALIAYASFHDVDPTEALEAACEDECTQVRETAIDLLDAIASGASRHFYLWGAVHYE